jgi:hypothetical protein
MESTNGAFYKLAPASGKADVTGSPACEDARTVEPVRGE